MKVEYNKLKNSFTEINELISKIGVSIEDLKDTIGSINEKWECSNSDYLTDISLEKVNKFALEIDKISSMLKKIDDKSKNIETVEKKIINS